MTPTKTRHTATFLLQMALDQERIRQRVASRLLAWRGALSQQTAAARLGISYRQYQRLERGQSTGRWRTLEQIADGLGISVADLIGVEESAFPASPRPPGTLDLGDGRFDRLLEELAGLRSGQVEIQAAQDAIGKRLDALATQRQRRASGRADRSDRDS